MYISKELIFKIVYIALTVIHIIIYLVLFYKLHKLKGGKTNFVDTLKEKGKELITTLLNPDNSIISGIIEFINNQAKSSENGDDKDKPEEGF